MANVREITEIVAEATGASIGTVRHVARRLGEARLLGPRIARGRAAPDLKPKHVAHLLVGVMVVADGLGEGAVQVGDVVQRVFTLGRGSTGKARLKRNKETGEVIGEFGSFIDIVAYLLIMQPNALLGERGAIGLTIDANGLRAWVRTDTEEEAGTAHINNQIFSDHPNTSPQGLQRKIELSFADIAKITSAILAQKGGGETAFEEMVA